MVDQFFADGHPRRPTTRLVTGLLVVLAGCSGSSFVDLGASVDSGETVTMDGGVAPDANVNLSCQPELSVEVSEAFVLPLELYVVRVEGGTGAYRFRVADNRTGGIINELSGAYLSGDSEGATDVIEVTDDGCTGSVRVSISVVNRIAVRPQSATVPSGTAFTFEAAGGTGEFGFRLIRDGSGATLTPEGRYTAGRQGVDRIEVRDLGTGEIVEASIAVEPEAGLAADPPIMFVPVGESYQLRMRGGSGLVEITSSPRNIRLENGRVVGATPGRASVTVRDQFTGQTAPLTVNVVPKLEFDRLRGGVGTVASSLHAPGDLNGDGYADLVFAHPEAAVDADRGGAIYVYPGTASGIAPQPAQIIAGRGRIDELGRSAVLADFDDDGEIDIAVGVPRMDLAGNDRGFVEVYRGVPSGFFEPEPYVTLGGNFAGDFLGWSVTACDFNNDGLLDIAAGAYNAEDRVRPNRTNNQGGVFIFLGHSGGFRDLPDQILWGDVPDGQGGWVGRADMHFGISLAAGDHDGDGTCDLAAGSFEYDVDVSNTNDGLVYVYKGVPRSDADFGGLEERPRRAWASTDPANSGSYLGYNLAMGDVDQDGRDDLLVSQYRFDAGAGDNYGAVRLFLGTDMTATATELGDETTASWSYVHGQADDYFGFNVEIADATGDDIPDVITGNYLDETSAGNQGTIRIFAGRRGDLPQAMPTRTLSGRQANDRLGQSTVALGDLDGDGTPEMAGFAYFASDYGRNVGAPLVLGSEGENDFARASRRGGGYALRPRRGDRRRCDGGRLRRPRGAGALCGDRGPRPVCRPSPSVSRYRDRLRDHPRDDLRGHATPQLERLLRVVRHARRRF